MPTPVSTARQCLTQEAANALDDAVNVARRRGHGQTTSLHAVSALLSLPSSPLRDACARARNSAYSPRLQFKALELCLGVSLDRVPTSPLGDESPPVSNSLMAAIKRSQANQRRQPENFNLYHQMQQQQSSSAISCIKVELQNLILSILDDPVVSRVFSEAGFRSSDIKLAIVRPLPQVLRFSRFKGPPLFLCNLSTEDPDYPYYSGPGRRGGFSFPFSGGLFYSNNGHGDVNYRKIGEVLVRSKGRNPLLVGLCAYDTLASFNGMVEKRKDNVLPLELSGLSVICIENDVNKFITTSGDFDKKCVDLRFEELGQFVERNSGPGLLVNFGDLKAFVSYGNDGDGLSDAVSYIIDKLSRLLQLHEGRVWLIGAASYENYSKFVRRFPFLDKDWDLMLLPTTSIRPSLAESYPRSSLMESFVPFGGFFSTPSDLNGPFSNSYQYTPRCHLCNDKCEQEILAVSKGGFAASIADQHQPGLPACMQMAEPGTNKGLDVKTRDDGVVLSAKLAGLQRKWDHICQCLHGAHSPGSNIHATQFPTAVGFQPVGDGKEDAENRSSNNTSALPKGNRIATDLQKISRKQFGFALPAVSEAKTQSVLSKQWEKPSKEEDLESGGLQSPCSFSNSSTGDGSQASPTSITSVTTDLDLRINYVPTNNELKRTVNKTHVELPQDVSASFSAGVDAVHGTLSDHMAQSSSSSSPDCRREIDPSEFKMLFRALVERVGWQDEAIHIISQTMAHCWTRTVKLQEASIRGDVWLNFWGPDRCGKKKIAAALAEIRYGSKENFISADLSPQAGLVRPHLLFDCPELRGKTLVDYVARELCKKPLSVVFLENVDKADVQARNSLSHAIRTGKFPDSSGREVGINNAVFVTTSTFMEDKIPISGNDFSTYSEESILRTKGRPMQILIEQALGDKMGQDLTPSFTMRKIISSSIALNKRKLVGVNRKVEQHESSETAKRAHKTSARNLDLNLPAEENDVWDIDNESYDNGSPSGSSNAWLRDFFEQVDRIVAFKPYDFDTLSERIMNEVNECFNKIVGPECSLDIDPKVMEQLLAAACLSDQSRVVEDWVEQVLSWGFVEVSKRYNLRTNSIVKLVACEGVFLEEQMPELHLPTKIIIN